jgi:hypothetical protein
MEVSDKSHAPAALIPGKGSPIPKDTLVRQQCRSKPFTGEINILTLAGLEPRIVLPLA